MWHLTGISPVCACGTNSHHRWQKYIFILSSCNKWPKQQAMLSCNIKSRNWGVMVAIYFSAHFLGRLSKVERQPVCLKLLVVTRSGWVSSPGEPGTGQPPWPGPGLQWAAQGQGPRSPGTSGTCQCQQLVTRCGDPADTLQQQRWQHETWRGRVETETRGD